MSRSGRLVRPSDRFRRRHPDDWQRRVSRGTPWTIVVVDANLKHWPSASKLVAVGVPLRTAERYRKVRWRFTTGLRRAVKGEMRN